MSGDGFSIERVEVVAFRQPVEQPVRTSFGVMRDRPAVFVRVEDAHGAYGWGEIFANWPASGAEHRCWIVADDLADLLFARHFDGPADLFDRLTEGTRIRALQCCEPGPFAQCIAGLDIAARDLCARRAGRALRAHLAPDAPESVPACASGIHVDAAPPVLSPPCGTRASMPAS